MEGDYIWIEWGLEEQDGENGAMVARNGAKGLDASVISNFVSHSILLGSIVLLFRTAHAPQIVHADLPFFLPGLLFFSV